MATTGHAKWTGGLRDGSGIIETGSGAVSELGYSAGSRFEGKPGTNPEELLGAAHAACFSMALTLFLETAGPVSKALTGPEITLDAKLAS